MSEGTKYPYATMRAVADDVIAQLAPHCERIEVAGSIRRVKEKVGDIEIVAIPKPYDTGLFESGIATVVEKWEKVKGELPCKYTQRILPNSVKLDIFFATPENWGLIYLIRTGSAEFSRYVAGKWVSMGYKSVGGMLHCAGQPIETKEEIDVFNICGLEYVEPENRWINS